MRFSELATHLRSLESVSSRLEITRILADIFMRVEAQEIRVTTNLLLGRLAPSYENKVFNIAERMMVSAIAGAYGISQENAKELYKSEGDLGTVAESLTGGSGNFSIQDVYSRLLTIAEDEGIGSQERKITEMAVLLANADPLSARYIARIPVGKLRLGFSDKTILDALSWMEFGDKQAKKALEMAYQVLPDVGLLAENVKMYGITKATDDATPRVGIPVMPMLAQRLKSPSQMIEKMGKVAIEPKLDGLRLSLHFKRGKNGFIKAYTRNLNETSWMFPELSLIGDSIDANEVILDVEAVGVDHERARVANFQSTMTRRRKHEIAEYAVKIPIRFYAFDILLKNGENLMDKKYSERRQALEGTIKNSGLLRVVEYEITDNALQIDRLNKEKRKEGLEGVMVKKLTSTYVPGRTGWRWVKMKESEEAIGKLADTIDVVIMGYTRGRGKRAVFGVGQFLAGVRDKEKIKSVTKVGTGLTDEQFKELKKRLHKLESLDKPKEYEVEKVLFPDYWVEPEVVVELAADEITKSPTHTAGLALRFPRLVRFRDDKSALEATTLQEIEKLFKLQ